MVLSAHWCSQHPDCQSAHEEAPEPARNTAEEEFLDASCRLARRLFRWTPGYDQLLTTVGVSWQKVLLVPRLGRPQDRAGLIAANLLGSHLGPGGAVARSGPMDQVGSGAGVASPTLRTSGTSS